MKAALVILLAAAVSLLSGWYLAAGGLCFVVLVLLVGDLVQGLPASACNHNCHQGDRCTCALARQEPAP